MFKSETKLQINAWHLPWAAETVPHAVLDINRGCNISCRACYNINPSSCKTIADISSELDVLFKLRKIQSLSIAGGEVTLHPELLDIIRTVSGRKVPVEIFTNGLLLDEKLIGNLKSAGVNVIFLHIEPSQKRKDLPDNPSISDCTGLLGKKAQMISAAGMEAGMVVTTYSDRSDELKQFTELFLGNPDINYFVVTLCRDMNVLSEIKGNILSGLASCSGDERHDKSDFTNFEMFSLMKNSFGIEPFACLGSQSDDTDIRWLSYLIGSVHFQDGSSLFRHCRPSLLEKMYMKVHMLLKGCYPFNTRQNPMMFRLQLFLNSISGGFFASNLKLIMNSMRPGAKLRFKKLLFQNTAEIGADGKVIHCRNCPDATVKNGHLVPLCIADKITSTEPAE